VKFGAAGGGVKGDVARMRAMRTTLLLVALVSSTALAGQPQPEDRLELARQGYSLAASQYRSGQGDLTAAARWSKRIYELQKATNAAKAGADYLYRMKDLEKVATSRFEQGTVGKLDKVEATWLRQEAELEVKK